MQESTVTLFCYHKESDTWYPYVLENEYCQCNQGSSYNSGGALSKNTSSLHIRHLSNYVKPKAWVASDHAGFTVREEDFYILGNYGSEPILDADYQDGFFQYMKKTYDDVYRITSIKTYGVIPHIEVGAE